MLECTNGAQCGGWVHLSCVGLDNLTEKEAKKLIDYVCPFCRAEGIHVNNILSPKFNVRTPSSFHAPAPKSQFPEVFYFYFVVG